MLPSAISLITAALVFYTWGVWAEHRAGLLRPVHAVLFACGLAMDATGTYVMKQIAEAGGLQRGGTAGVLNQIMSFTGTAALVLMAVHAGWAVIVLLRSRATEKRVFHRFSVGVWALWLVPYFTGMLGSSLR